MKLEECTLPYDQITKKLRFTCTARLVPDPVTGRIGQQGGKKREIMIDNEYENN